MGKSTSHVVNCCYIVSAGDSGVLPGKRYICWHRQCHRPWTNAARVDYHCVTSAPSAVPRSARDGLRLDDFSVGNCHPYECRSLQILWSRAGTCPPQQEIVPKNWPLVLWTLRIIYGLLILIFEGYQVPWEKASRQCGSVGPQATVLWRGLLTKNRVYQGVPEATVEVHVD